MHELAIAETIFRTVCETMERNEYRTVRCVGMRIGVLTDVVPESLTFGFDAITKGTPLESTRLEIESVPIRAVCNGCGEDFAVERFEFVCPRCDSRDNRLTQGNELDIAYLEIDRADAEKEDHDRAD